MVLNEYGQIVREEWFRSAEIRKEIELENDEFIVMPNHIHGIVYLVGNTRAKNEDMEQNKVIEDVVRAYGHTPLQASCLNSPSKTLGSMIRSYKGSVTTRINTLQKTPGNPVWLRNYFYPTHRQRRLGGAKTATYH
jgi:REP element-mobilizing transposase RayT